MGDDKFPFPPQEDIIVVYGGSIQPTEPWPRPAPSEYSTGVLLDKLIELSAKLLKMEEEIVALRKQLRKTKGRKAHRKG